MTLLSLRKSHQDILVIEDEDSIRDLMAIILNAEVKTSYNCFTSQDFHLIINDTKPHLIILEVRLSIGNGLELCKAHKSLSEVDAKVLLLSTQNLSKPALLAGADAFLEKPFSIDDLNATVDTLL